MMLLYLGTKEKNCKKCSRLVKQSFVCIKHNKKMTQPEKVACKDFKKEKK